MAAEATAVARGVATAGEVTGVAAATAAEVTVVAKAVAVMAVATAARRSPHRRSSAPREAS